MYLKTAKPVSPTEFQATLKACPLTNRELAVRYEISPASARRWREGLSIPHEAIRQYVVADLLKDSK